MTSRSLASLRHDSQSQASIECGARARDMPRLAAGRGSRPKRRMVDMATHQILHGWSSTSILDKLESRAVEPLEVHPTDVCGTAYACRSLSRFSRFAFNQAMNSLKSCAGMVFFATIGLLANNAMGSKSFTTSYCRL
jgi:hypothetical protein